MYEKDYSSVKNKWLEFWAMENHDRPILSIFAPNGKISSKLVKTPATINGRWLDAEYVISNFKRQMECTYYAAEAFPMYWPNLGPDIIGAIAGCDLGFSEETSWAKHFVKDWSALPELRFDENNFYFKKLMELTNAAIKSCNGEYLIGNTDIHAGMDGLVALRSPQELCLDVIDCPELLKPKIDQLFEIEKETFLRLNNLIDKAKQQGTTNWMGIWHPEKIWYPTSCDFSCMISKEDFEEFTIPNLINELKFFGPSIYHLDGVDALRHLDRLLKIPELNGIEFISGFGKPSIGNWIPELQKIQKAGKRIMAVAESPNDIKSICENLKPEGIFIMLYVSSAQEADFCIKMAENICKIRRKQNE